MTTRVKYKRLTKDEMIQKFFRLNHYTPDMMIAFYSLQKDHQKKIIKKQEQLPYNHQPIHNQELINKMDKYTNRLISRTETEDSIHIGNGLFEKREVTITNKKIYQYIDKTRSYIEITEQIYESQGEESSNTNIIANTAKN